MKPSDPIASEAGQRGRLIAYSVFLLLVGTMATSITRPALADEAGTSFTCTPSCTIFNSKEIKTDNRARMVATIFQHTDTNPDWNWYAGAVVFFRETTDYYQHHNWNVQWSQRDLDPDFFDRQPGFHDDFGDASFGLGLGGPTLSWKYTSNTWARWEIKNSVSFTDEDGWHSLFYHEYKKHGDRGYAHWDHDAFGLSVKVKEGQEAGVWMYGALKAGPFPWDATWRQSDYVYFPVQTSGSAAPSSIGSNCVENLDPNRCLDGLRIQGIPLPPLPLVVPPFEDVQQTLRDVEDAAGGKHYYPKAESGSLKEP